MHTQCVGRFSVPLLILAGFALSPVQAEDVTTRVDLPAQPLGEALGAVGRQSNINVFFDASVVEGRVSPPLKLRATLAELFATLLAGSGLSYRFVDEKTVVIGRIKGLNAERTKAKTGQDKGSAAEDTTKVAWITMISASDRPPLRLAQSDEGPLYAQNVAPQPTAKLGASSQRPEEIIVTARKIAESIQTVPVSITALSGTDLERMSVRNVSDLQYQVPNLVLQPSTSDTNAMTLALRGQKQNDILPTVDASVGLYIDNVYYPRPIGLTGALIDIDHVEVLRGPQGTLYGRNTTGGALSLYTANPTNRLEGNASAGFGNYSERVFSGMLNVPLTDNIAGRIVARRGEHDGYGRDRLGRTLADEDSYYVRGKLRGDFDGVEVILSGIYQQNQTGGAIYKLIRSNSTGPQGRNNTFEAAAELGLPFTPAGLAQAAQYLESFVGGNRFVTDGTWPPSSDFESHVLGLDITVPLSGGLSLRSTTSYVFVDRTATEDGDGTPLSLNKQDYATHTRYIAEELQLHGGSPYLNWVAGLYAGDESAWEYENVAVLPALNPLNPIIFAGAIANKNQAAYAQANWQFAPKFRLTGGLRWSRDERELKSQNSNGPVCVVPAPGVQVVNAPASPLNGPSQCPRTFDKSFSKPSGLLSLDYQATDNVFGYAKVSYGYRSGGFNFRGGGSAASFAPFKPETVTEYEVGTKLDLFDRIVRFNLAVYHDDYEDVQVTGIFFSPTGTPIGITSNAAKARINGMEAELRIQPFRALTFTAGAGLTDAHFVHFVDSTGDRSREPFPVPRWTGNAAANYAIETSFGNVTPSLDFHYQSASTLNAGGTLVGQAAYGLANARVAFNILRWDLEVAAYGRNLANKVYVAQTGSLSTTGDPHTYGVTLTKRFGRE